MKLGESRPAQPFRADPRGCPDCRLELICHPDTGRWVCPACKFTRDRMQTQNTKGITTMELTTIDTAPTSLVTLIDLASRWGVSVYVATARLRRAGISITQNASGKLAIDSADIPNWGPDPIHDDPPTTTPGPDLEHRLAEDIPQTKAAATLTQTTPKTRTKTPDDHRQTTPQTEASASNRRLILALQGIRALADVDDSQPLTTIHTLASYAIQAETGLDP